MFFHRTNCFPVPLSEGFGQLENLKQLDLRDCDSLTMSLTLKEKLDAQGCKIEGKEFKVA